jgi:hypothetical protein
MLDVWPGRLSAMYRQEFEYSIDAMELVMLAAPPTWRARAAGLGPFGRRLRHLPGIFPGMISHPSPEAVVSELGDKVTDAIVRAVAVARDQFELYRQQHPAWAAENAARTIAGMIHDWMWAELKQQLDLLPHVNMVDKDPRREIAVQVQSPDRLSYLMRIKLHHLDGRTSSYQTQTVIDFELQGRSQTFPGWDEVRLEAGYEWDKDARTMGAPVISLRDGRNNVVWVHELPDQAAPSQAGGGTMMSPPSKPGPTAPVVEVLGREADDKPVTDET